jgi:hypothetical protein
MVRDRHCRAKVGSQSECVRRQALGNIFGHIRGDTHHLYSSPNIISLSYEGE